MGEGGAAAAGRSKSGSCLCGAVRFEVNGPLRDVLVCHCEMCRRLMSAVGAYSACRPEDLTLVSSDELAWYRSSDIAERGFCRRCGTQLFWKPAHGRHMSIAAGAIDPPTGLKIEAHIFLEEKGDFYGSPDAILEPKRA